MIIPIRLLMALKIIGVMVLTPTYAKSVDDVMADAQVPLQQKPLVLPNVSQEEMVLGLLRITENLKTAADFTPGNIEKWLKKSLHQSNINSSNFLYIGQITRDWKLFFTLTVNDEIDNNVPLIAFNFSEENYRVEPSPSMTGTCIIDADAFSHVLIDQNYDNYSNTHKFREYRRGKIYIHVSQRGESSEKVRHRCIYKVIIRTLDDNGHIL